MKASYKIIIEVSDNGQPRQSATRVLQINVLDVDDHAPRFVREIESQPLEMSILEEQPGETVVGNLTAIDEDIGENAAISYVFVDGNQENVFKIVRNADNSAKIVALERLDREVAASYLLVVKCFKSGTHPALIARKSYDPLDMSEVQVLIKIVDIDDHLPEFVEKSPSIGVRFNVPVDTSLISIAALDKDPDALPISYAISNVTFETQFYKSDNLSTGDFGELFFLNNVTGEVRTAKSLSNYVDGFFDIIIRANNSVLPGRVRHNKVRIYVIRDKSLLRFVFKKSPTEVREFIEEFGRVVQAKMQSMNLRLNILDTKVLTRADQSLDFTATSSCFQLTRHGAVLPPNEMQAIIDAEPMKRELSELNERFGLNGIDSCSVRRSMSTANVIASAGTWMVIVAGVVGIFALISTCTACCLIRK